MPSAGYFFYTIERCHLSESWGGEGSHFEYTPEPNSAPYAGAPFSLKGNILTFEWYSDSWSHFDLPAHWVTDVVTVKTWHHLIKDSEYELHPVPWARNANLPPDTTPTNVFDPALTGDQLRALVAEATKRLIEKGEFPLEVEPESAPVFQDVKPERARNKRNYYRLQVGDSHAPRFFQLIRQGGIFEAVELKPTVLGRKLTVTAMANDGDAFKIVKDNGDFDYMLPVNGELSHIVSNLADLSDMQLFFEQVEAKIFSSQLRWAKKMRKNQIRSLEESKTDLPLLRKRQWKGTAVATQYTYLRPKTEAEWTEWIKRAEDGIDRFPALIIFNDQLISWLEGLDRSQPTLDVVNYQTKAALIV